MVCFSSGDLQMQHSPVTPGFCNSTEHFKVQQAYLLGTDVDRRNTKSKPELGDGQEGPCSPPHFITLLAFKKKKNPSMLHNDWHIAGSQYCLLNE